jgi:hypothetical protein
MIDHLRAARTVGTDWRRTDTAKDGRRQTADSRQQTTDSRQSMEKRRDGRTKETEDQGRYAPDKIPEIRGLFGHFKS